MLKEVKREEGFTLVELAIVLVIVGLLIAGVLKGRSLIQEAKVKNVMKAVDSIRAATLTFYDRYGMYPGDENSANFPDGDTHDGDGDGQIEFGESDMLFEDLQKAGMISGSYDGDGTDSYPKHAFGDLILLYWQTPAGGITDHWFRLDNLPWDVALEIDTKLDDGVYNTGSVVASEDYVPASGSIGNTFIRF
ncbi:prepilin-type N-terminal cleavage/methylation domain-containing protein [Desulfohalobiaceae bacterium Ax17]|uniref:type II secretion system protein n=1 Tax=Desulfovulcanus ferrireducens TaxID=2831190 RepID=UPI00207BBA48|nr:prepilin-type N-terminal cleavage/methylation domain-containing protein [Desulfovulcanus ferrireducens]MBT8764142.1 prepilin-type N-terminal cleavage/methylation domain-containing protein [Desulfovulcanus ferrireducens]